MSRDVGVLALQGDFTAHAALLRGLGRDARQVRRVRDLDPLGALVIPGGESTALLKLMADEPWFEELRSFHRRGGFLLGTCAGAILLAREVHGPAQPSLGLLDASIDRNAYGRQLDSFEADLVVAGVKAPVTAAFIRAPRFAALGPGVEVLARHDGVPVLVRDGRVLAATFHPEITGDPSVHRLFLDMAGRTAPEPAGQRAAGR
ncbi:MAG TPA: pyridoxal 5'-phosphate synthase glutaminase subunit PdxT [Vicinamibacteria bacterium]